MEDAAREKTKRAKESRPENAPGGIVDQKFAPRHVIDTGEEGSPCAQNSDEAAKEDRFIAMFGEKFLSPVKVLRLQEDVATKALN